MNSPVITMKPRPLLIGIIVVLVMLCSPVLAFDKSDILSSYNAHSAPSQDKPESYSANSNGDPSEARMARFAS